MTVPTGPIPPQDAAKLVTDESTLEFIRKDQLGDLADKFTKFRNAGGSIFVSVELLLPAAKVDPALLFESAASKMRVLGFPMPIRAQLFYITTTMSYRSVLESIGLNGELAPTGGATSQLGSVSVAKSNLSLQQHEATHLLEGRTFSTSGMPVWLSEGLATFIPDVTLLDNGRLIAIPFSTGQSRVYFNALFTRNGELRAGFDIENTATSNGRQFYGSSLRNYGQSYVIFLFLLSRGKVGEFSSRIRLVAPDITRRYDALIRDPSLTANELEQALKSLRGETLDIAAEVVGLTRTQLVIDVTEFAKTLPTQRRILEPAPTITIRPTIEQVRADITRSLSGERSRD